MIRNRYFWQFQEEAKCHKTAVDLDSNLKSKFIISKYRKRNLVSSTIIIILIQK